MDSRCLLNDFEPDYDIALVCCNISARVSEDDEYALSFVKTSTRASKEGTHRSGGQKIGCPFPIVTMSIGTDSIVLRRRYTPFTVQLLRASNDEFEAYDGVEFPPISVTPCWVTACGYRGACL